MNRDNFVKGRTMPNDKPHGALGSNKPLERVPVEEPVVPAENEKVSEGDPVPTSSATNNDGDVVYLREDLRPSR